MGQPSREADDFLVLDEAWTLDQSETAKAERWRAINRLFLRGRSWTPPRGLADGEEYRTWLLANIVSDTVAMDKTASERKQTQRWRDRITAASSEDLWDEYVEKTRDPKAPLRLSLHRIEDLGIGPDQLGNQTGVSIQR